MSVWEIGPRLSSMARTRRHTSLKPPFLKRLQVQYDQDTNFDAYPFSIPAIKNGNFQIDFDEKVTIIVGDNGSGKSTLLEAIAARCGFSLIGGTQNHINFNTETEGLSKFLRLSWMPKVSKGFFLRAETFFSFIQTIDTIAEDPMERSIYDAYGGKSLRERSHGESFLALFENRFGNEGIFILDEPEAALSPTRQLEFLKLLRRMELGNRCQVIIATHSLLLMAYPGAQLLRITDQGMKPVTFYDTPHYDILSDFCADPEFFMSNLLCDIAAED